MLVKTYSAAVNGLDVTTVRVEVNIVPGVMYHLTGLGDTAVREGRDRIASALQFNGYKFPHGDITINLAPADLRKEGSSFDLPLAIAILAASGAIVSNSLDQYMMVGELGLDGTLQPIKGALPIAIKARAEKLKGLIVPKQNEREAAVVNNLEVYGMNNIMDVIKLITGAAEYEPTFVDTRREFYEQQYSFDLDFADVRGQESVRRALEVAAAGGHNLIMVGPPGSGKSMMAKRLPSILPPLSLAESLETTQIHSVAGKLQRGTSLISQRPFRAPHHTISEVALVGRHQSATRRNIAGSQRRALRRRTARIQQEDARSVAPAARRPQDNHLTLQVHRRVPLLLHVHRLHESMPVRLLQRPDAQLLLFHGADSALHEQDIRTAARPH